MDEEVRAAIQRVLSRYPLSLALLFGSGVRDSMDSDSDVDIAVEFDDLRPEDDGYSEVYLGLLSELDDALSRNVDLVDVHTLSPQFAYGVFDEGVLLLGTEERRAELARTLGSEPPSVDEARKRVAASVERLREDSVDEYLEHAV